MVAMPKTIEERREYARQYRANNPERFAGYEKKHSALKATWRKANPEEHATNKRRQYFRQTYGLTLEQIDAMLAAQDSKCATCKGELTKRPHVDHCHDTGNIRGVLCGNCNNALGLVHDNPATLRAMADYIELHKNQNPKTP